MRKEFSKNEVLSLRVLEYSFLPLVQAYYRLDSLFCHQEHKALRAKVEGENSIVVLKVLPIFVVQYGRQLELESFHFFIRANLLKEGLAF